MKDSFYFIRCAAKRVLNAYREKTNSEPFTSERATHSQLESIAREVFGLTVTRDYLLPEDTFGRLDLKDGVIGYSPDLDPTDRDFTVAHELGHRALEHPEGPFLEGPGDIDQTPDHSTLGVQNGVYRSYSGKSRFELEANVFAAELLAPVDLVRTMMHDDPQWSVEALSGYFGLSKTAMLNQIAAAMLPLPDEEELPIHPAEKAVEDPSHIAAINATCPALVQAGPGAGKTRVLVGRYARLVREGAKPRRILALTFANKAAAEMRERISRLLPDIPSEQIVVTTFHSLGLDLIRKYHKTLRYKNEPTLLTPADTLMLLRRNLAQMPLGRFESISAPASRLGLLLDAISRAKDELVTPEEFADIVERWQKEVEERPLTGTTAEAKKKADSEREHAAKCRDAAEFYQAYEDLLREHESVDYGDLIRLAVHLLEETGANAEIRAEFDHILVDEFQDVNHASGRLVRALDGGRPRSIVWAVGDVRQSIYRFRGASPANMLRFEERFPGAVLVPLGRNYRSVEDVVACGALVPITDPFSGELLPHLEVEAFRGRPSGLAAITLVEEAGLESELAFLEAVVKREKLAGTRAGDIAILCRTRKDAQRICDHFEAEGIETSWAGDPMASPAFKDVLSIVALAAWDLRGLERAGTLPEHPINRSDLLILSAWRKEQRSGLIDLLRAGRDNEIQGLSPQGVSSCRKLLQITGQMAAHKTAYTAIASYLFETASWCRELIAGDTPQNRRALASVRQMLTLARCQMGTPVAGAETPITAFLGFIETAIQSDQLGAVTPDLGNPRLVNVMTVHASKGLEWPVVLVPFLNDGKIPSSRSGEKPPVPGGLSRDGDPIDDKAEEACLFFVAVTRARDRLVLSRAPHGKWKKSSRYLEPLVDILTHRGFLDHHFVEPPEIQKTTVDEEAVQDPERVFDYSDLSDYGECPRRFEYGRILGLSGGDKGYLQYHRSVADAADVIMQRLTTGEPTDEAAILKELDRIWSEKGPIGHFYEPRLRFLAGAAVSDFSRRLASQSGQDRSKEVIVDAGGRKVRVRVDEFEEGPPAIFRRLHFTGPSKSHLGKGDDDRHALYAIYAEQNLGRDWQIEAYYPALGEARSSEVTSGMKGPLLTNRRKKMKLLSAGIIAEKYPATGDDQTCMRCPFFIVCSKDDASADDGVLGD